MKKSLTNYLLVAAAALCLGIALPTANTSSSFLAISNDHAASVTGSDKINKDGGGPDGFYGPEGPHHH